MQVAGAPDGRGVVLLSALSHGGPLPSAATSVMLWLEPEPWRVVARRRMPLYARAPSWSPDGGWLALEGDGIEVLDTRTRRRHAAHAGGRGPLCWTPDSRTLIGVVDGEGLFCWTLETDEWRVLPLSGGTEAIHYAKILRVRPDGRILAIGSEGGFGEDDTLLLDLQTGAVDMVLEDTLVVFWRPDGQECALLGQPPTLRQRVGTPALPVRLPPIPGRLSLSPSGRNLLMLDDAAVATVDLSTSRLLSQPAAEFVYVNDADWVGDDVAAVIDDSGDACLIDASSGQILLKLLGVLQTLLVGILPDGSPLLWQDGRPVVVDEDGAAHPIRSLPRRDASERFEALIGDAMLLSADDNSLIVHDLQAEVTRLRGHNQPIRETSVSADGRFLFSTAWDGTLRIWSTVDWSEQGRLWSTDLVGSLTGIPYAVWSPIGARLAVQTMHESGSSRIRIWEPGGAVRILPGEALLGWLDGDRVLLCEEDSVSVWCVQTGSQLAICPLLDPHQIRRWAPGETVAAWSPERLLLWTPSGDLVVLLGRDAEVGELVWSAGGLLLSLEDSGRLCCWDAAGTRRWQRDGILAMAAHPTQDTVLVVDAERVVCLSLSDGQSGPSLSADNLASVRWEGGRAVLQGSAGGVGGERIRIWDPETGRVRCLWGAARQLFSQEAEEPIVHDGQAPLLAVRFDGETEWLTPASSEGSG